MLKYNFLDFKSVLDSFITEELNRTSLKDNYATQIVIFLIYIPTLLGIIAFLFDFSTLLYIIKQSVQYEILGTILGVLVGLIGASIIFLSISLGTLRSAKNLRIFWVDLVQDAKTHKWAILSYTPKLKNLFYALLVGGISVLGLEATLYLSTHAKVLVTAFVEKPTAEKVQVGLINIRTKEENAKSEKLQGLKRKRSNLEQQLKTKINANSQATTALNRLNKIISDSINAVASQWKTINTKQNAIKNRSVTPKIAIGYKKDIEYRKNTILPPLEQKYHRKIEQKRRSYHLAIQGNLEWYDQQLSLLHAKEEKTTNKSDSLTNWLTNLYQTDINTQIANIDFLAFFAAGGNRYINICVFLSFCVLGFFAVPDFGDYKALIHKKTQTHKATHKTVKSEFVWYNNKKTKASQVRTWIKTYTQRIQDNTQILNKLEIFAKDRSISDNERATANKKAKTIRGQIKRATDQLKLYENALKNSYD